MVVLGIGSAHVDLFIKADAAVFSRYASFAARHLDLEAFNALAASGGVKILPGGCAANTVRGLACLGQPCAFLSCVGEDREGAFFLANLKKLGIRSEVSVIPEFATIRLLCLIGPDGEKRILYPKQDEPRTEFRKKHFEKVGWVHLDAFQFEIGNDLEKAMELSRAGVSLNLGNAQIAREYREQILLFLEKHADLVFGNEEEIKALTGLDGEKGCSRLQEICPLVAMTRGARGCLIADQRGSFAVPGFPAEMVDATGAGDYFASGFLFGHLRGDSVERCGALGNRLGSAIVEVVGTELPQEKWDALRCEFSTAK